MNFLEYRLTLKTAPTSEPLIMSEVKDFLRLDDNYQDYYIQSLIIASRRFCENYQNRAYITQSWYMTLDDFCENIITLPKGNLQTINSIKYKDNAGNETTLVNNTDYVYSIKGISGRVCPAYGKSWPSFTPYPLDAVIIDFTCGYGLASTVPETIKQAMLLLISHWYENRTPLADKMTVPDELNFAVTALLWQERIVIL